tara:strand:- start:4773 stop:5231 length:459 start_codon:yes stop_codon:yes gene_type:complete
MRIETNREWSISELQNLISSTDPTTKLVFGKNFLADFEFDNSDDFELIKEAKDDVYVKIERECRIIPFVGMKQPTPSGGILGYEAVLTVKHLGEPFLCRWEIYNNTTLIASGTTDVNGTSGDLPIPMAYGNMTKYQIKILAPEIIPYECANS